jgi:drug/metabolite transporter (DMT)-like permease
MWIFYAIFASLCWGVSYAACGPLLKKGLHPLIFLLGYSLFGFLGALIALVYSGKYKIGMNFRDLSSTELGWFFFSVAGSALGAYLTYAAMGAKNPTLVALIEISYPIFVVLFAWLFFREMQLNSMTLSGGVLVLTGITVIIIGGR